MMTSSIEKKSEKSGKFQRHLGKKNSEANNKKIFLETMNTNKTLLIVTMMMMMTLALTEARCPFGRCRGRRAVERQRSSFDPFFGIAWPEFDWLRDPFSPMPLRNWMNVALSPRQMLSRWPSFLLGGSRAADEQEAEQLASSRRTSDDDDDDNGNSVAKAARVGELTSMALSMPSVDVSERDDALTITLDAPGTSPSDIRVSVSDDQRRLVAMGERRESSERDDETWHVRECSYGKWKREFALEDDIDVDKISAAMNDGVLSIELPKRPLIEAQQQQDDVPAAPSEPVKVPVLLPRKSALHVEDVDEEE
jgi:HSP20 family protein